MKAAFNSTNPRQPLSYLGGYDNSCEEVPAGQQLFPKRQGDKSFYKVLISDLTRSIGNGAASADGGSNHVRGSYIGGGVMPAGRGGANVGYVDGHVEWKNQDALGYTDAASITSGNPAIRAAAVKNCRQLYVNNSTANAADGINGDWRFFF